MTSKSKLLHRALAWNATFSGLSAIVIALNAAWLATQLGLPGPVPVYVVAGCLAVFAAQLGNIVRTGKYRHWEISGIIAGDLAWVAASAALAVLFFERLTFAGLVMIDSVALVVLAFAIQQIRGLRALRT